MKSIPPTAIVCTHPRRLVRLDGKNRPTGEPERGTGYAYHPLDLPVHSGPRLAWMPREWVK